MSMINEFVKKIRIYEREYRSGDNLGRAIVETEEILKEAADIIEELSAKLAGANMERSEQYYKDVPDTNVGNNLSENLIEKIKFGIEASNINDDYTTGLRNGMRYCLSLIDGKEPEFERCKQGWILVSEALPDEEGSYLVTFDDGYVSSAPFYDENWELWCDSGEPVAWQPLPEPYKGE